MRNKFMLVLLALGSIVVIATYDFGNEYVPYNAIDYANVKQPDVKKSGIKKPDPEKSEKKNATKSSQSSNNKKASQLADAKDLDPILKMQLELAVVSAKASAQCGMNAQGGYRNLNPDDAAKELVILMNSSQSVAANPSDVQTPPVMYVLDNASAAWQVVVRADTENKMLFIEGFGTSISQPVFSEAISCQ